MAAMQISKMCTISPYDIKSKQHTACAGVHLWRIQPKKHQVLLYRYIFFSNRCIFWFSWFFLSFIELNANDTFYQNLNNNVPACNLSLYHIDSTYMYKHNSKCPEKGLTFVSICRVVHCITFGKCNVASSRRMKLDTSANSIKLCAKPWVKTDLLKQWKQHKFNLFHEFWCNVSHVSLIIWNCFILWNMSNFSRNAGTRWNADM